MKIFKRIPFEVLDWKLVLPNLDELKIPNELQSIIFNQIEFINKQIDLKLFSITSIYWINYIDFKEQRKIISDLFNIEKQKNPFLNPQSFHQRYIAKYAKGLYSFITDYDESEHYINFGKYNTLSPENFYTSYRKVTLLNKNLIAFQKEGYDSSFLRIGILNGFEDKDDWFIKDYLIELVKFINYEVIKEIDKPADIIEYIGVTKINDEKVTEKTHNVSKNQSHRTADINFKFALLEEMGVIKWLNTNIPTNNKDRAEILQHLVGGSTSTLEDYLKGKSIHKEVRQKALDLLNEKRFN